MSEDQQKEAGELTAKQEERLKSLRQMVRINIDGDWDEQMIQAVFNELDKVMGGENADSGEAEKKGNGRPGRRRGRR